MIELETTRVVEAGPREVLEFCFDPISYQSIDPKITKIHADQRGLGRRLIEVDQRVGPIRLPRQVLQLTLDRWTSITFEQVEGPWVTRLLRYRAQFLVDGLEEGSIVTHRYAIGFRRPIGWLTGPLLRRRLSAALEEEMDRLVDHFDDTVVELDSHR